MFLNDKQLEICYQVMTILCESRQSVESIVVMLDAMKDSVLKAARTLGPQDNDND